ncbi:MAG TPA: insulinase family protein [Campylobacterales bacterium]|nr:insulinase family protein [Campylobacterales bacterium]HHS92501.1 insulinase family protein [Campylobacterales bacterium]
MGANLSQLNIKNTEVPFIFEEDKNLPIVSMQLVFENSGSLADTQSGIAKLLASLLNEGTKKEGSVAFATKLENRAISISSNAGQETFVIEVSALKSEFTQAIEYLKELLQDPNYSEGTLTKIKTDTLGTLQRKESDFDYLSSLGLKKILFPNTPLANAPLGTVESVEKITLKNLKKYFDTHLGVENAIVVMGGDLAQKEAESLVLPVLELLTSVKQHKIETMKAVAKKQIKKRIEESQQAYIYFGSPLDIPYDSKALPLSQLASFILGSSGFGSRMMEEIRVKKGLAYSAYSKFHINKTNSYFSGYLQTKVESGDEAVASVQELVKTFIDKGVTQEELESAQQFLLGSEPLRNETLSQRLGRAFNEYYKEQPLGFTAQNLKKIEAVTLEELNSFIKKHQELEKLSFFVLTGKRG